MKVYKILFYFRIVKKSSGIWEKIFEISHALQEKKPLQ